MTVEPADRSPIREATQTPSLGSRLSQVVSRGLGKLVYEAARVPIRVRGRYLYWRAKRRLARLPDVRLLSLGSGRAPIPGWINIDAVMPADVLLDLRYGIPVAAGSIDLIYSEHLIEHLSLEDGIRLMAECRRVLKPRGRLRFATPDLADIVRDYQSSWRRPDWVNWPEYAWVDSGTRMLNTAVRHWGHLYLYDYPELERRLLEAGFRHVERCEIGQSPEPLLRGLETRLDSRLIAEAIPSRPEALR